MQRRPPDERRRDPFLKGGVPGHFGALLLTVVLLLAAHPLSSTGLDVVIQRMATYVDGYGAAVSLVVGVEKYTQSIIIASGQQSKPRRLTAEFAVVRVSDGWVGFRDVITVDDVTVRDRGDRLLKLLTGPAARLSDVQRIADESARYNVGPVVRNLNVPTTALFFFTTSNLGRFRFDRKRTARVNSEDTVEFAYREIGRPTFVMTRGGADVPLDGSVWVRAADGVVVRTRIRARGFADEISTTASLVRREIKTVADITVTFARHDVIGLWLPSDMVEEYEGPIKFGTTPPIPGVCTTRATYSDYRQFQTDASIR